MSSPLSIFLSRRLALFVPALVVAFAMPPVQAADVDNPLAAERWKTRPVVVVVPQPDDGLLQRIESALQQTVAREAFREREMVLYTVVAGAGRRNGSPLTVRQSRALLDALQLDAAGPPTFVLVGKDGGVKMTEGANVDLNAVFAEIDRMPMRR